MGRALRDAAAIEQAGPGCFRVELSPLYTVMGHPNGGYLQCVIANAAAAAGSEEGARHLHVTSISTNYVRSPDVGPAQILADVRRVGRDVSFVHVTLRQGDVITTESLVTLGTLHDISLARYIDAPPVEFATLEACHVIPENVGATYMSLVDLRLDPTSVGWWLGEKCDRAEVKGWVRLNDGDASWNVWNILFACDVMPPATMPVGSSGWVPTLQLTSYVRRVPQSEWLRVRQWCVVIADGTLDERCELFDDRGEMVASSSQLAMVRFSRTEST
jgi:acyl-CoA thioesterase